MKVVQKSVRLSQRVYNYINRYRGDNFCDKLQNYVLDTEERRDDLVKEWNLLESHIQDKHQEMVVLQSRLVDLRAELTKN